MYGEGMFYIKDIDIWKNKLRLTVSSELVEDQFITMNPANAQELVNKIWMTVEDYQNKIRQGIG
jgi:hypothetical protein